eukprot:scaffold146533_cov32-Tisochrysis_lutea.AAC.5
MPVVGTKLNKGVLDVFELYYAKNEQDALVPEKSTCQLTYVDAVEEVVRTKKSACFTHVCIDC